MLLLCDRRGGQGGGGRGGSLVRLIWVGRLEDSLREYHTWCDISVKSVPFLQILDARYPSLGICDHLREEIREARPAELCISTPVQVSVVDGLAV